MASDTKIYEVYVLMGLVGFGLLAFLIWMIYEAVSNPIENPGGGLSLQIVYLIVIATIIFIFAIIIIIEWRKGKLGEDLKNTSDLLKDFKGGTYQNEGKFVYWSSYISALLFIVFMGVFAYYSSAGTEENVLGINYERPLLPGASYGEDPLSPEQY